MIVNDLIEAAERLPFYTLACVAVCAAGCLTGARLTVRAVTGVPCHLCRDEMTALCRRCTPTRPDPETRKTAA